MAVPNDAELKELLQHFVCVRIVQMWGVDLARYQFDGALTWAVFLQHADGTIYARYGTRSALQQGSDRDISLSGFKHCLRGALSLHERFTAAPDAVRPEIAGKQPTRTPPWPTPEQIPALASNPVMGRPFGGFAVEPNLRNHGVGCIHCHMVPDHQLLSQRTQGLPLDKRQIWPFPMPGAIGLQLDPEQRATIRRVQPESVAAAAGLRPGDQILRFGGQTILSTADVQWVLHEAPAPTAIPIAVRRGDEEIQATLQLAADWRRRLGDWRFVNLGICMRIAGFNGRPTGGGGEALAIQVQRVHQKRLADVDLKARDVIVAIDGRREPMNLGQLTELLLRKKPGSEIEVTRRRPGVDGEVTLRWKVD